MRQRLDVEVQPGLGDEYKVADIALFPWVRDLVGFYGADFSEVDRMQQAFLARPAVQRGLTIPARG